MDKLLKRQLLYRIFIISLLVFFASFTDTNRPKTRLQKIFESDKFSIINTEYGGFFKVVDSLSFTRTSNLILMEFFTNSKVQERISRTLTEKELRDIELLIQPRSLFSKRCATNILQTFNESDTVSIVDERCKRIIDDLKEIVKDER